MSSYTFKLVLLGQGSVGKTSLVLRYISDVFNESHQSTLQASFLRKQLYLEKDLIKLNIWDTAGQEKFHALGPIYYREANGALLVYDVTNPDSLRKVRDWVKELNKMLGTNNIRLAIIGNKIDLLTLGEQKCPQNNPLILEAIQFTNELMNARHYLTSAKLNQGISELFTSLSKRMVEQTRRQQTRETSRFASTRSSSTLRSLSMMTDNDNDDDDYAANEDEDYTMKQGGGGLRRRPSAARQPYGSRIDLQRATNRQGGPPSTCSSCWKT